MPDIIVPPRSNAVPSDMAGTAPTQRDAHLRCVAKCGRMGWQKASGYDWRALIEADIGRYKRVVVDTLRSRTDGRQVTEVAIAIGVPNRMLELGRPKHVRIAWPRTRIGLKGCARRIQAVASRLSMRR